jgi:hypothetical protein
MKRVDGEAEAVVWLGELAAATAER